MSDALVQALVLTAIVITLGVAAFLLAIIHRSWTLDREDDLIEDTEDRSVRRRLARGEHVDEDELDTTGCEQTSDTDDDRAGAHPRRSAAPGPERRREPRQPGSSRASCRCRSCCRCSAPGPRSCSRAARPRSAPSRSAS